MRMEFDKMTNAQLAASLNDYARVRKGEIADMTSAASDRINALSYRIAELERENKMLKGMC